MNDTAAVSIVLGPSRLLAGGLIGVHAASLVPLWRADLPAPAVAVLATAIIVHGAWSVWLAGWLRSAHSITGIELHPGGGCALIGRNGGRFDGVVADSTVILGSMVVLAVKAVAGHATRRAVVVRDMISIDDFRRFRVALKWGDAQAPGGNHV